MKASSKHHGTHSQANAELRQANTPKGPLETSNVDRGVDVIAVTLPLRHIVDQSVKGAPKSFTYQVLTESILQPEGYFRTVTVIDEPHKPKAWDRLTDMFSRVANSNHMQEALQESQVRILANIRVGESQISIVHYRLPGSVRNVSTSGVLLNAIFSLGTETDEPLSKKLMQNGLAFLGCIGDQTQETVNTIAQRLKESIEAYTEHCESIGTPGLEKRTGLLLTGTDCDIFAQASIEQIAFAGADGVLLQSTIKPIKPEEKPVIEQDQEPKGAELFGYEADSLTIAQKREALEVIGYDTSEMTDSVISSAFVVEQETFDDAQSGELELELEDPLEGELEFDEEEDGPEEEDSDSDTDTEEDEEDEDFDLDGDLEEDEDEDEAKYQEAIQLAKEQGVDEVNVFHLIEELGIEVADTEKGNSLVYLESLIEEHLEEYDTAAYAQAVEILKSGDFTEDQSYELANRLGLVGDRPEEDFTAEELTQILTDYDVELEDELEDDVFEASADEEDEEEYGQADDENYSLPEEPTKYLTPAGQSILGDMYKIDVNQVLVVNFTFTNSEGYSELDVSELADVDNVNYMFPFQVGQKRAVRGSMMLPAVRTIDMMDNMNPGQVLVCDPTAFDPDEFSERFETLMNRALAEALYEDRVPSDINPEDYDLPVGEFSDADETDAEIAFIEGFDEDLEDFNTLVQDSPSLPITQLYSGFATVRKLEIDGQCTFTNGVVLNFAVPGIWLTTLPEDKIQEMLQGAINATRTRVAGNSSCPTYCAFTYDSGLLQSNDRIFELVSSLRNLDEEGMSFNSEDVRIVEEAADAFSAIATIEDRELPLTVLMSGIAGSMYDHGGNTSVIFPLNEEEAEDESDEE